jgi:hypothetical protein
VPQLQRVCEDRRGTPRDSHRRAQNRVPR